jgi:hypothetical protein
MPPVRGKDVNNCLPLIIRQVGGYQRTSSLAAVRQGGAGRARDVTALNQYITANLEGKQVGENPELCKKGAIAQSGF